MSEKLLQAILDELISLNKKIENIEEVVEIISVKMNDTEEQLEKLIQNSKKIDEGVSGVRRDISDLQSKVIDNIPSLGTLDYIASGIAFSGMVDNLKQIEKNTR